MQRTKGVSTQFKLYFPIIRKELVKDEYPMPVDLLRGNGESILVVDDVEEQRVIVSMMLSELGYSVTTVSSGEEAVEYLKKNSVDLLVLDMIMDPGIDGLETYKHIQQSHTRQKAILVSEFTETDKVKEAQSLGAGKYMQKPYSLQQIGIAVKKELDKKHNG